MRNLRLLGLALTPCGDLSPDDVAASVAAASVYAVSTDRRGLLRKSLQTPEAMAQMLVRFRTPLPALADIHVFSDLAVCFATRTGDIYSLGTDDAAAGDEDCPPVGSFQAQILAMAWSPSEAIGLFVTWEEGAGEARPPTLSVVAMNRTWDILFETTVPGRPSSDPPTDVGPRLLAWRRDGAYYAVCRPTPRASVAIYTSRGRLVATTPDRLLAPIVCWRPNPGNDDDLILGFGCDARGGLGLRCFEKNGLERERNNVQLADMGGGGHPSLAATPDDAPWVPIAAAWNASGSHLALIVLDAGPAPSPHLLLCSFSNYRWYLKHRVELPRPARALRLIWDPAQPGRLYVLSAGAAMLAFTFADAADVSAVDGATVGVIDGPCLRITALGQAILPPPLAHAVYDVRRNATDRATIDRVAFLPGDPATALVQLSPIRSDGTTAFDLIRWTLGRDDGDKAHCEGTLFWSPGGASPRAPLPTLLQLQAVSATSYVAVPADTPRTLLLLHRPPPPDSQLQTAAQFDFPSPIAVLATIATPPRALVALQDGSLWLGDSSLASSDPFTRLAWTAAHVQTLGAVISSDGDSDTPKVIALDERGTLWRSVGTAAAAASVHTFLASPNCPGWLIYTTANGQLVLEPPADEVAATPHVRRVEPGATLVAAPSPIQIVLQAPRGNLEAIEPRPLVRAAIVRLLRQGAFLRAIKLAQRHGLGIRGALQPHLQAFAKEFAADVLPGLQATDLAVVLARDDDGMTPVPSARCSDPRGSGDSQNPAAIQDIEPDDAVQLRRRPMCDPALAFLCAPPWPPHVSPWPPYFIAFGADLAAHWRTSRPELAPWLPAPVGPLPSGDDPLRPFVAAQIAAAPSEIVARHLGFLFREIARGGPGHVPGQAIAAILFEFRALAPEAFGRAVKDAAAALGASRDLAEAAADLDDPAFVHALIQALQIDPQEIANDNGGDRPVRSALQLRHLRKRGAGPEVLGRCPRVPSCLPGISAAEVAYLVVSWDSLANTFDSDEPWRSRALAEVWARPESPAWLAHVVGECDGGPHVTWERGLAALGYVGSGEHLAIPVAASVTQLEPFRRNYREIRGRARELGGGDFDRDRVGEIAVALALVGDLPGAHQVWWAAESAGV